MKVKIKNVYNEMKPREGTKQIGESMTDQSQAEETDIYSCLKKYGITSLVNKTQAQEFLYLDNTNRNMTLDEAVRQRKELEEYFKQQPARVRKVFGDNVDMFIEKYNNHQFDEFLQTGILNEQMIKDLKGEQNVEVEKDIVSNESISTNISKGDIGIMGTDNASL